VFLETDAESLLFKMLYNIYYTPRHGHFDMGQERFKYEPLQDRARFPISAINFISKFGGVIFRLNISMASLRVIIVYIWRCSVFAGRACILLLGYIVDRDKRDITALNWSYRTSLRLSAGWVWSASPPFFFQVQREFSSGYPRRPYVHSP
jgi:hypothetical protein